MRRVTTISSSVILIFGLCGTAMADSHEHTAPAPQDNRCWGESASGLAQIESGAMGQHSRSAKAPGDSFADAFGFGEPRQGVGNVSKSAPHNTDPGDGGNGQHAVNNGTRFSEIADPVTGKILTGPVDPSRLPLPEGCSTGLVHNLPF